MSSGYRKAIVPFASVIAALFAMQGCTPTPTSHRAQEPLARVGAQLFSDVRLSADGKVSCASCHLSAKAFADGEAVSIGAFERKGTRNAPSLLDLTAGQPLFWDGREHDLSVAVLQPFANPREMGHENMQAVLQRITALPEYRKALSRDGKLHEADIAAALVAYLRSLDAGTTLFERARKASDLSLLGHDAEMGLRLFQGKAQCASCHAITEAGAPLTDGRYHHTGIGFDRIAGNIAPLLTLIKTAQESGMPLGRLVLADQDIAELGRFAVTGKPQDLGAFRTPTLRNVANTAPYMHDGSIATLEAAIEHELYYRGLIQGRPIKLTVEEQRQLAAFLRTLSIE
ncbi:MAG: cytochrome c peroxidase [Gammaproteobacteria bacterium]